MNVTAKEVVLNFKDIHITSYGRVFVANCDANGSHNNRVAEGSGCLMKCIDPRKCQTI